MDDYDLKEALEREGSYYEEKLFTLETRAEKYRKALEEIAETEGAHAECSDECNQRETDPVFIARRALEEK